jgi:hypothetical protein
MLMAVLVDDGGEESGGALREVGGTFRLFCQSAAASPPTPHARNRPPGQSSPIQFNALRRSSPKINIMPQKAAVFLSCDKTDRKGCESLRGSLSTSYKSLHVYLSCSLVYCIIFAARCTPCTAWVSGAHAPNVGCNLLLRAPFALPFGALGQGRRASFGGYDWAGRRFPGRCPAVRMSLHGSFNVRCLLRSLLLLPNS